MIGLLCAAAAMVAAAPAGAAWYEAKSPHFIIYADENPKQLEAFATKLEKFDNAVRVLRGMDDPALGDAGKVSVYVLPSTDAVSKLAVGKESPIAGFYEPRASGSVAFVPQKTDGNEEWDINADTVFFHEYSHHLQLQNTDAALPPWLVEGFAEFYSTAQFEHDGSVRLGNPAMHRVAGLYLSQKPSMEVLLGPGLDAGTAEQMDAFYGWAWVLTHYLTFDPARKGQLARYIAAIRNGDDLMKAANEAFGDLKQLDRDTDRYLHVNRFEYLQVNASALKPVSPAIRQLRPGEAAVMPARIRSTRGVDDKSAGEVAQEIRAVATSYPNDPFVQRALAEAEFDAHNYGASRDAASRALALDPTLEQALVYKGRAEMELAAASAKPDWSAVQAEFLKANKLDTEDPEPLLLYYESFGRAGQRPTANAADGLIYALALAPQDKGLRLMAVSELIAEKKFAEARDVLAPLAFDPHSSSSREHARKTMAALAAQDPQAALAALRGVPGDDGHGG